MVDKPIVVSEGPIRLAEQSFQNLNRPVQCLIFESPNEEKALEAVRKKEEMIKVGSEWLSTHQKKRAVGINTVSLNPCSEIPMVSPPEFDASKGLTKKEKAFYDRLQEVDITIKCDDNILRSRLAIAIASVLNEGAIKFQSGLLRSKLRVTTNLDLALQPTERHRVDNHDFRSSIQSTGSIGRADPRRILLDPMFYRAHPEHEIESMMDSIRKVGLVRPIAITENGVLFDGYLRVEAWRRLSIAQGSLLPYDIPCEYLSVSVDALKLLEKAGKVSQQASKNPFLYGGK